MMDMDNDTLEVVFAAREYSAHAEAEVLKSLLDSAGIDSVIRWAPPTFQNSGGVRLLVLSSFREEAEELIRAAREASP